MPVGADWLSDEGAELAAAVAAFVSRQQFAVTCQSLADAPPSCAAPSTQRNVISSAIIKVPTALCAIRTAINQ